MTQRPKEEIIAELKKIEERLMEPDFWNNKNEAQEVLKRMQDLKDELDGVDQFDKMPCLVTIYAGAGGDDAEDFTAILFKMYQAFLDRKNWEYIIVHQNENEHGGYRNISFQVNTKNAFNDLKHEAGVHRLVRISPFNANDKRHTSFAMVEVIPLIDKNFNFSLEDKDLQFEFKKSSGPGGQNVNKRETAVRIVHVPTGLSALSDNERSQERNREKALEYLTAKVYNLVEKNRKDQEKNHAISQTVENEWGSQIRSYVFHPYQLIKDHRTGLEIRDLDKILKDGDIDEFIEAMRNKNSE